MADSTDSEPDELKKPHARSIGAISRSRPASSIIGSLENENRYVNVSSAAWRRTASTRRGWQ